MMSGVHAHDAAHLMKHAYVLLPPFSALHCMPAPLTQQRRWGNTPLKLALIYKHTSTAEYLRRVGGRE